MQDYIGAFRRYAVLDGRSRRREYWTFVIGNSIVFCLLIVLYALLILTSFTVSPLSGNIMTVMGKSLIVLVYSLFSLAVLVPGIALTVRRLHDTGRGGGWFFISLVPIVGPVVHLVLMCADSGPNNRFGPNPKASYAGAPNVAAGWLPDPTGRHEVRYWDSVNWTDQVANGGIPSIDPMAP